MRSRRRILLAIAALVALAGCHTSEKDRIHKLLTKGADAAESADVRGVTDLLADDFRGGGPGGTGEKADKQMVKAVLASRLLRGQRVTVIRRNEEIAVEDGATKATASFDAALLEGDRASMKGRVPSRIGTWHFDLTLEKRDGDWLVTGATWKQIPAADFIL